MWAWHSALQTSVLTCVACVPKSMPVQKLCSSPQANCTAPPPTHPGHAGGVVAGSRHRRRLMALAPGAACALLAVMVAAGFTAGAMFGVGAVLAGLAMRQWEGTLPLKTHHLRGPVRSGRRSAARGCGAAPAQWITAVAKGPASLQAAPTRRGIGGRHPLRWLVSAWRAAWKAWAPAIDLPRCATAKLCTAG